VPVDPDAISAQAERLAAFRGLALREVVLG
jgi:hypothetical protein